ncbi:unnamed protein product [Spirodela intermedia]|uniref:Uncharacterized protein n=1 Tax=Spirodela intermedia TaxID=51605 RepID=A0A7I8JTB9_SPIIN|nr:unnamed protein product [Spirodela intermedia]CAA6673426.1 unnamed protein product [Spirodela intermedia]
MLDELVQRRNRGIIRGSDGEGRGRVREGGTEHDGQGNGLPPWEQHASVISLPRFDYRTPSLLLECSHSGFLITCPIIYMEKKNWIENILIVKFSGFV